MKYRIGKAPITLFILIMLLVATYFMFHGNPDVQAERSTKAFWNLGHVAYFALFTLLLGETRTMRSLPVATRWIYLLSFSLVFGIAIEYIQHDIALDSQVSDVLRDLVGGFLTLTFRHLDKTAFSFWTRRIIRGIAIFIFCVAASPLVIALVDEYIAVRQFPVLSDFETPFELQRWQGKAKLSISQLPQVAPDHLLKVVTRPGVYSGAKLVYMPSNWTGYRFLHLKFYNPQSSPVRIAIRAHDLEHETGRYRLSTYDRYQHQFVLEHGWNVIDISLNDVARAVKHRKLDLSRMINVSFYTPKPKKSETLYLSEISLR